MNAFSLRQEARQGCELSLILFNMILGVLAIVSRWLKLKKKSNASKLEEKK